MHRLLLLLTHMYLQNGQTAEHRVIYGIGIKLCKLICSQRGSCMSIAYDADRLECRLSHKDPSHWETGRFDKFPQIADQIPADVCSNLKCKSKTQCVVRHRGDAVCVKDHTSDSILEVRCTRQSDCPAGRKFVCFHKTCKCEPGYSFSPASNSCVRRCKKYGDGFTTYLGIGIKGHNDKTGHNTTVKGCSEMCIKERTFTCITFDIPLTSTVPFCQLSKSGYLDVPGYNREIGLSDWGLVVRHCA